MYVPFCPYDAAKEVVAYYTQNELFKNADEMERFLEHNYTGVDRMLDVLKDGYNNVKSMLGMKTEDNGIRYLERAVGTREQGEGGYQYAFGGQRSNTADKSLLSRAMEMDKNGDSKEQIFKDTGWFKGADGKWRFEINDADMHFGKYKLAMLQASRKETIRMRLSDLIKHKELFEQYPRLAEMPVVFGNMGSVDGEFRPSRFGSGIIILNNSLKENELALKQTLIHEIQHAIQDYESFASGANPAYWQEVKNDNTDFGEKTPYDLYFNTAGEIEARDASSRLDMTDTERRENFPESAKENPDRVFAEGTGESYSIIPSVTDDNGNTYNNVVLLDTQFFNGISPRNWGQKLKQYINRRIKNSTFILPIIDENGKTQMLEFANPKERVTYVNGKNKSVINKLSQTKDNLSKLSVLHIDEIVSVSEENNPYYTTGNNKYQWLDKNGWLHRNAVVGNVKNNNLYRLTFDIAKTSDGRLILYATDGKINNLGHVSSGLNSLSKGNSSWTENQDYEFSISHPDENVNPQFSKGTLTEEEAEKLNDETSKLYESLTEKDVTTDETKEALKENEERFKYTPISNKKTYGWAKSNVDRQGIDEAISDLTEKPISMQNLRKPQKKLFSGKNNKYRKEMLHRV